MGPKQLNILYLADPNSIHDRKWMQYVAERKEYRIYVIVRKHHYQNKNYCHYGFDVVGVIDDFSLRRMARTVRSSIRLIRLIRQYKINIFHVLYAEPNALWLLLKNIYKIPVIISTRGSDVLITIPRFGQQNTWLGKFVFRLYYFAFRNADVITSTSHNQINSIKAIHPTVREPLLVRTGVDIQQLRKDTTSSFPLKNQDPYILLPRLIKPVYNHEFVIEAFKHLPKKVKNRIKLVLVGKDAGHIHYQQYLLHLLHEDVDICFEFLPMLSQESIYELYKRATMIVMTPKSDGSSVSAMESILVRKPLILGPLPYDADIANNAFQLDDWSQEELTKLILFILSQPTLIDLPDIVYQKFDRKYNMDLLCSTYQELADKKNAKC
jgi:hypothetical protein